MSDFMDEAKNLADKDPGLVDKGHALIADAAILALAEGAP